jgi:hypothetical protein
MADTGTTKPNKLAVEGSVDQSIAFSPRAVIMDNEQPSSVPASAMNVRHSSSTNSASSNASSPVRYGSGGGSRSGHDDDATEVVFDPDDTAEVFAVLPADEKKVHTTNVEDPNFGKGGGDATAADATTTATATTTTTSTVVNAGTSFTADSPYFDAFCQSELAALDTLSTTLNEISMRAKIFAQTGSMMSQATLRLANACRLRHGGDDEDLEPSERSGALTVDPILYERRKTAIGDEMAGALELLGEVRLRAGFSLWCCWSAVINPTQEEEWRATQYPSYHRIQNIV